MGEDKEKRISNWEGLY